MCKRRRLHFMPMDTLSSDRNHESEHSSDRANENDLRPFSSQQTQNSQEPIKRDSGIIIHSPNVKTRSTSVKFQVMGELRCYDLERNTFERDPCILVFVHNWMGSRCSLLYNKLEIFDSMIDFNQDVLTALFEKTLTCFAIILREPRSVNRIPKTSSFGSTRVFLWKKKDSERSKLIRKIYEHLNCASKSYNLQYLPSKPELIRQVLNFTHDDAQRSTGLEIKENPIVSAIDKSRRDTIKTFWNKAEYSSLSMRHGSSLSNKVTESNATRIGIPRIDTESKTVPNKPSLEHSKRLSNINTLSFYSRKNALTPVIDSSLKSRLRSPSLKQHLDGHFVMSDSDCEDISDENDVEEDDKRIIFKPKLRYDFDDSTSYTITNQDFKSLYNHDWINDTILDFFTKYFAEQSIRSMVLIRNDIHIMTSFFYTKLISNSNDYYENVKKWIAHVNLFEKKYVVVPINVNYHWFGAIITNLDSFYAYWSNRLRGVTDSKGAYKDTAISLATRAKTLDSSESTLEHDAKASVVTDLSADSKVMEFDNVQSISNDYSDSPLIELLTFDSLRQPHFKEIEPLKLFLISLIREKLSINVDKSFVKMRTCLVPQQPNMSDCGVHVIMNLKTFYENPAKTIETWKINKVKSKAAVQNINIFFDKGHRRSARKELRDILVNLQEKHVAYLKNNGKLVADDDYNSSQQRYSSEDEDFEIIGDNSKSQETLSSHTDEDHQRYINTEHQGQAPVNKIIASSPVHDVRDHSNDNLKIGQATSLVEEPAKILNIDDIASKSNGKITPTLHNFDGFGVDVDVSHNSNGTSAFNGSKEQIDSAAVKHIFQDTRLPSKKSNSSVAISPYFSPSLLKKRKDKFPQTSQTRLLFSSSPVRHEEIEENSLLLSLDNSAAKESVETDPMKDKKALSDDERSYHLKNCPGKNSDLTKSNRKVSKSDDATGNACDIIALKSHANSSQESTPTKRKSTCIPLLNRGLRIIDIESLKNGKASQELPSIDKTRATRQASLEIVKEDVARPIARHNVAISDRKQNDVSGDSISSLSSD